MSNWQQSQYTKQYRKPMGNDMHSTGSQRNSFSANSDWNMHNQGPQGAPTQVHGHGGHNATSWQRQQAEHELQVQHQQQIQAQKQKDAQITMRTQLLIDDTEAVLDMTDDYLMEFIKATSTKKKKCFLNQKVAQGLMAFNVKVEAMMENAEEEDIDFTEAFKCVWVKIRDYEKQTESQYGDFQEIMKRLPPIMKYMKATLKGKEVPTISYVKKAAFNGEVASKVLSKITGTMNHALPEKMDRITKNKGHYKKQQEQLAKRYVDDDGDDDDYKFINDDELTQDFFGVKQKPLSGAQQKAMMEADTNRERHRAPDLEHEEFGGKRTKNRNAVKRGNVRTDVRKDLVKGMKDMDLVGQFVSDSKQEMDQMAHRLNMQSRNTAAKAPYTQNRARSKIDDDSMDLEWSVGGYK